MSTALDHDSACPVFRGADPDECDGDCAPKQLLHTAPPMRSNATPTRDRAATGREMRRLQVLLRQAGVRNRTERLARVSEQVGRPVASCTELTEREVRVVAAWADQKIQEKQR
ncbi:hypothetical protein [Pseudonocardia parietis]|uniref:Uncharacterized protein n=1 Tax=Pseudonocardia parietis TaxID=570936 RepID=A0ABS4W257_9PSEU|nr:hypothetical protein [Pseudonocardia parietis]MBP2370287.1 hypothetical protein [Pseudonocardia parietis]